MKIAVSSIFGLMFVAVSASLTMAADAAPAAPVDYTKAIVLGCAILAAGFGIAIAALGTGIAQGNGLTAACNSVGRNPDAQGKILLTMLVGLAMIESLCIYALVISLVLLYANPLLKYIGV